MAIWIYQGIYQRIVAIFACKSPVRLLQNSKKKQCEKNISAIIIFFPRSVYQQFTLSFILSSSAVSVSLTGVGIAIGASVGVTGLICGIASVITASGAKKVSKKVIKHEKTLAICESKVNSIKDRISKAQRDNKISDEEFSSILSEVDKYNELKSAIRAKYRRSKEANEAYVEDLKNRFVQS